VAGAGDVNGDGYSDVVVGAYLYDSGESNEGAAFVFHGGASGVASGGPAAAATTLQGNQENGTFGYAVASACDVNGDGFADVLVGAIQYDSGQPNEGAAFVFLGSASGVASGGPASAAAILQGDQSAAEFGRSVAGAGDVNGDGFADVLVGARFYDDGEPNEGAAFVFLGSILGIASGGPASAAATLQGNQAGALLGTSVAGAGDVNGDGFGDVLVGAQFYDSGQEDEGAAFVFLGSASGIMSGGPASAATTLESNQISAALGVSVDGAGDTNGDGFADVLVGAYLHDNGGFDAGAGFLFLGSAAGIASSGPIDAAATLLGIQASSLFGYSVAGAGDVNGDGFADVVVGAYRYDVGATDEGAAFVFLGNEGAGRPVLARQFRAGTATPVAPWGGSLALASFDARMANYHPQGGGLVKLEIEACPAGKDFGTVGAGGCVSAVSPVWANVTATAGLTLSLPVTGLTAARLHHWRARTLYAPVSIATAGILPPPKPGHGPWRRLSGQALEADLRTLGGVFYTLAPCRMMDTRTGSGAPIVGPILTSGIERTLPLVNKCGVPVTAHAISANLTAVSPTGPGQFVLYPIVGAPPTTSNLSFNVATNRANNTMLGLNRSGQIQVLATVNNPAGPDEVHLVIEAATAKAATSNSPSGWP
jgi:FG-GAP repeat